MGTTRDANAVRLVTPARPGSSAWLLHLRWLAGAGQLVTIVMARLITSVQLPYLPLLSLVGLTAITNLIYGIWLTRAHKAASLESDRTSLRAESKLSTKEASLLHAVALGLMLLDLVTLTAMLAFSGGVENPFCFFYFVNLAVGGVMIRPKAAWSLSATAVAGFTCMMFLWVPIAEFGEGNFDVIGAGEALVSVD